MSRASDAAARNHERDQDQDDVLAEVLGVIAARLATAVRAEELLEAPSGERRWRKVASTSTYDAWLVAWAPGAGIPEHDHGGATAVFHVVRGTLVERTEARARVVHSGCAASVPPWRRHAVRNLGAVPALSLHVYSPPLGDSWKADSRAAVRKNHAVRITAKADYAVRAAVELAAAEAGGKPVKGEQLARNQGIPHNFLENILTELRRAGIVRTRRGADGGYQLARPAAEVTVADVLRAVEGPLAAVQGVRPDELQYGGAAVKLPEVWVALRASLRDVLEHVSIADIARKRLPDVVRERTRHKDAWRRH